MAERRDEPLRDEPLIDRRTLHKAAVWSVPVVAAVVAAPLAVASPEPQVNLWSTARLPASRDGVHTTADGSFDYYQGPRTCSFTYDFGNFGPDTLPSGATLTIGLPFAAIWTTGSLNITGSDGYAVTPTRTRTETIDQGPPLAVRQLWDFALASELAAGASFTLTFTVPMNGVNNTATNFYRVRTTSNFQPGPGVTETVPSNNSDNSDNYAFFNYSGAGG